MWITYEEFSVSYKNLISLSELFNVKIVIYENNKYYNIYPIEILNIEKLENIIEKQNEDEIDVDNTSDIYSYVYKIEDKYYVQYHNYEYDYKDKIEIKERYNGENISLKKENNVEYVFEISENQEAYLKNILECTKYKKIGITVSIESNITKET